MPRMRETSKALCTMMWSGWVYGMKGVAAVVYPDDRLAALFDAMFVAGDNVQRGAIDLVAGLLNPDAADGF